MPPTVLMIAQAFPPAGGSGVQRTLKFAKYLPHFGWRPIVMTADHVRGLPQDPQLLADLPPQVRVQRIAGFDARGWLRRTVPWRLRKCLPPPFPDDCARWGKRALRDALRLLEREPVDVLYSTYSPASNHLVALKLKQHSGLPWVADFRDLWTDDFRYKPASARLQRQHRLLEQQILETADRIVAVTPAQTQILAARCPLDSSKFVTITNGFDADDFRGDVPIRSDRTFRLAYVGRFAMNCTPPAWFDGLRKFVESLGDQKPSFELHIVGSISDDARHKLQAAGAKVQFSPYVHHRDAVAQMRCADALLVMMPDIGTSATVIPGKLFEYLAAGRPILSISPKDGECEKIITSTKSGLSVPPDAAKIHEALHTLFVAWKTGNPLASCKPQDAAPFERRMLTQLLSDHLTQLVHPARKPNAKALQPAAAPGITGFSNGAK